MRPVLFVEVDGLDIKTLVGTMTKNLEESIEDKSPKHYKKRLK